jgi:pyruvate dehydrogenase E2 component (dihydrolipoamide acetyltransferase)
MIYEVFMPALSSTMTEGKIVSWAKEPGDKVEKGETVVVVESDKADMDVESFYEGYLGAIVVPAGETAPVGEAIALIAETEAEIATAQQQATGTTQTTPVETPGAIADTTQAPLAAVSAPTAAVQNGSTATPNGRVAISPRARKLAKELKVDLGTLRGSGPHGRIVAEDVEAAAGKQPAAKAPTAPPPPPSSVTPLTPKPAVAAPSTPAIAGQQVPLTTLQNAVVRNMVASLEVPTYHVGYTITTDNLDKLYKQIKSKGVTMTALLAKAVAITLQKHPLLNASYTNQSISHPSTINVAVAVAMDDGGLITPVLQQADQLDIYTLSRTWKDLVDRARSKQLQPVEYTSGTFTLSNLGMFGVDRFDAILPPGTGAILAIGASLPTVVATDDGLLGVKRQMQVNLTCDHRVIYGAHAAAFLKDLAKLIDSNTQSLTL